MTSLTQPQSNAAEGGNGVVSVPLRSAPRCSPLYCPPWWDESKRVSSQTTAKPINYAQRALLWSFQPFLFLQPSGVPSDGAAAFIGPWAGKGVRKSALIGGATSKRFSLLLVGGNNRHPSPACACACAPACFYIYGCSNLGNFPRLSLGVNIFEHTIPRIKVLSITHLYNMNGRQRKAASHGVSV